VVCVVVDDGARRTGPVEDGLAVHVLVAECGRRASWVAIGGVVEDLEVVSDVDAERSRARPELVVDVIGLIAARNNSVPTLPMRAPGAITRPTVSVVKSAALVPGG